MSQSDVAGSFETLASEISALCADAIEHDRLADIPDDSLGSGVRQRGKAVRRQGAGRVRRRGRSGATAA